MFKCTHENMRVITTTELRTKSKQLIEALREGYSVDLIHRSRVVGKFQPAQVAQPLTKADIEQIQKFAVDLNLPKLSYRERERRYGHYLTQKYGKSLP